MLIPWGNHQPFLLYYSQRINKHKSTSNVNVWSISINTSYFIKSPRDQKCKFRLAGLNEPAKERPTQM